MIVIDGLYYDIKTGKTVRAIRYVRWRDRWEVAPEDGGNSYLASPRDLKQRGQH